MSGNYPSADPMSLFQNGGIMNYRPQGQNQNNAYGNFMSLGRNLDAPNAEAFRFYNNPLPVTPDPPPVAQNSFMDNLKTPAGMAAGAQGLAAIAGTFLGLKASRLAKDQLNFQKDAFLKQFNMQVQDREQAASRRKASATGVSQY